MRFLPFSGIHRKWIAKRPNHSDGDVESGGSRTGAFARAAYRASRPKAAQRFTLVSVHVVERNESSNHDQRFWLVQETANGKSVIFAEVRYHRHRRLDSARNDTRTKPNGEQRAIESERFMIMNALTVRSFMFDSRPPRSIYFPWAVFFITC